MFWDFFSFSFFFLPQGTRINRRVWHLPFSEAGQALFLILIILILLACWEFTFVFLLLLFKLAEPFSYNVILNVVLCLFLQHLVGCTHLFYLTFHPSSSVCHTPVLFNTLPFLLFSNEIKRHELWQPPPPSVSKHVTLHNDYSTIVWYYSKQVWRNER